MAKKLTYLYRVEISDGTHDPVIEFCSARNADAAVEGMKELYPDRKKYSKFECFPLGISRTTNRDYFGTISGESLSWLRANRSKAGEKYRLRSKKT